MRHIQRRSGLKEAILCPVFLSLPDSPVGQCVPSTRLGLVSFSPRAKIHAPRPSKLEFQRDNRVSTLFALLLSFRAYSGSFPGGRLVCSVTTARGLKRNRLNSTLPSLTVGNEQHRWSAKLLLPAIPPRLRLLLFLLLLRGALLYEASLQSNLCNCDIIESRDMYENTNYTCVACKMNFSDKGVSFERNVLKHIYVYT